jgi:predicted Zn-dependent protease
MFIGLHDSWDGLYLQKNMTEAALQVFQNLVQKHTANPTYRYHLGMALLKKGDKARAKQELEAALQNRPSSSEEVRIRALLAQVG